MVLFRFKSSAFLGNLWSSAKDSQFRSISFQKLKTLYTNLVPHKVRNIPPYNHIVQIGDPVLRTVSDLVPKEYIKSSEIMFLLEKMKMVFKKYKCLGLSASQIGVPLRILMFEFSKEHAKCFTSQEQKNKEMKLHPFTVMINPEMNVLDYSKVIHTELCGSIKGFSADVPRYRALTLKGYNENADFAQFELFGWNARIVQHELDHLNGLMYTDIMDKKSLACTCWEAVNAKGGRIVLPYGPS